MLSKLVIFMALPDCPRLGTMLFRKEIIGELIPKFHHDWNRPVVWLIPFINPSMEKLRDYSKDIMKNLTKNASFPISALDVPALLAPVPNYIYPRNFQEQFPESIGQLIRDTEPDYFEAVDILTTTTFVDYPKLLNMPNYIGKLLGQHISLIMEIMFHSTLR